MMLNQAALDATVSEILTTVHNVGEHECFSLVPIHCEGTLTKRRDVYEGPRGSGVSYVFSYIDADGRTWAREINVLGNETERTCGWHEISQPAVRF